MNNNNNNNVLKVAFRLKFFKIKKKNSAFDSYSIKLLPETVPTTTGQREKELTFALSVRFASLQRVCGCISHTFWCCKCECVLAASTSKVDPCAVFPPFVFPERWIHLNTNFKAPYPFFNLPSLFHLNCVCAFAREREKEWKFPSFSSVIVVVVGINEWSCPR